MEMLQIIGILVMAVVIAISLPPSIARANGSIP
jgi:hypothetical protein